jgi:hypothetical protein
MHTKYMIVSYLDTFRKNKTDTSISFNDKMMLIIVIDIINIYRTNKYIVILNKDLPLDERFFICKIF